jgi:cytochrome c oxidase subunit 3
VSAEHSSHGPGDGHDDHGHGHGHGSPFIQHHYDDAQHQFDAGKLGIWFFLAQEVLFFSALFVAYILYRHHHPEIYAYASHYLDVKWGAINTGVLIVSSLSAAWAVRAAQLAQRRILIACLAITILCALGFLGIKYVEYSHKIHEGILFGQKFDPCVASGGAPLLNKSNDCAGRKSSVVWDKAAGKAARGCLDSSFDSDRDQPGLQAECVVSEVVFSGKGAQRAEASRRELPACEAPPPDAIGWTPPKGTPCYRLVENPWVCPTGGAAMAFYPDHKVRGSNLEIVAECAPAAPASTGGDAFVEPTYKPALGAGLVAPRRELTKHEQMEIWADGPPPPNTNMFFSIYFAMTGLHGIHVLVGVGVFVWLLIRAIRGDFTPDYFGPIDYAALYWHLVDLIWIFLFPLLYLIH